MQKITFDIEKVSADTLEMYAQIPEDDFPLRFMKSCAGVHVALSTAIMTAINNGETPSDILDGISSFFANIIHDAGNMFTSDCGQNATVMLCNDTVERVHGILTQRAELIGQFAVKPNVSSVN